MKGAEFPFPVRITWQRNPPWTEICAWAMEHMGLPGGRYVTSPTQDFMDFHFRNNQDQLMFILAWGNDGH